jgi:hypothetical protein
MAVPQCCRHLTSCKHLMQQQPAGHQHAAQIGAPHCHCCKPAAVLQACCTPAHGQHTTARPATQHSSAAFSCNQALQFFTPSRLLPATFLLRTQHMLQAHTTCWYRTRLALCEKTNPTTARLMASWGPALHTLQLHHLLPHAPTTTPVRGVIKTGHSAQPGAATAAGLQHASMAQHGTHTHTHTHTQLFL